jgi:hypothetical protein
LSLSGGEFFAAEKRERLLAYEASTGANPTSEPPSTRASSSPELASTGANPTPEPVFDIAPGAEIESIHMKEGEFSKKSCLHTDNSYIICRL